MLRFLLAILLISLLGLTLNAGWVIRKVTAGGGGLGFDKSNLVVWHDFDGDLTNDHNPGTHNATGVNSIGYTTGPFATASNALDIDDPSDQYVYWTDHDDFTSADDYSWVMWISVTSGASTEYWLNHTANYYFIWQSSGRIGMDYSDDNSNYEEEFSTGTSLTMDDTWHHVAIVFDESANTVSFYLNGALINTATFTTETGAPSNGADNPQLGTFNGTAVMSSHVARYSLWTRALTAGEIEDLYTAGQDDATGRDVKYADL